jgi:hypothetical protein
MSMMVVLLNAAGRIAQPRLHHLIVTPPRNRGIAGAST